MLLALRKPWALHTPQLWAEDGSIFLMQAEWHGVECLLIPYMGYLPEPLRGVPRLATPRLRVEPGSVGLTGKQTAIYPLPRPGGWNIIGRTPLRVFDADREQPALMAPGDRVKFVPIGSEEFDRLERSAKGSRSG